MHFCNKLHHSQKIQWPNNFKTFEGNKTAKINKGLNFIRYAHSHKIGKPNNFKIFEGK